MMRKAPNIYHPGKILREEFLEPSGISIKQLATNIKIEVNSVKAILEEKKDLDSQLAARLALYFQTDSFFWLNLQRNYDEESINKLMTSPLRDEIKPISL